MKCKLLFSRTPSKFGFTTKLEKIKILSAEGKFIKWGKHNDSILEYLQDIEIPLPEYIDIN